MVNESVRRQEAVTAPKKYAEMYNALDCKKEGFQAFSKQRVDTLLSQLEITKPGLTVAHWDFVEGIAQRKSDSN